MTTKTKIFIGILVFIVISTATGWWIWNHIFIEKPLSVCEPKEVNKFNDVSFCNKSCKTDEDCKFTCGCGAINNSETCHDQGTVYDCVEREVMCENNICVAREEKTSQEVIITTDKKEYERGETVKITIKNNLDQDIWYWDNSGEFIPLVGIQIFKDGKWQDLEKKDACACKENCTHFSNGLVDLKAKGMIIDSWDTKADCTGTIIEEGKYRTVFTYYLDAVAMQEKKINIYSNEFTIKEKVSQCSPIDFAGYELVKNYKFGVDLNNDGEKEIVRIYWDPRAGECFKSNPIMVKVFSGTENCPKEVFSYGWGNQVGKAEIFQNFWGDGSNVVLVEGMSYACGCGGTIRLLFLTYREGKYSVVEGPEIQGLNRLYVFAGENGLGKKIIVAREKWAPDGSDYCCGCASKRQFMVYTWNEEGYMESKAGITQNYYSSTESIENIIQKEPSVLNLQ